MKKWGISDSLDIVSTLNYFTSIGVALPHLIECEFLKMRMWKILHQQGFNISFAHGDYSNMLRMAS